jgi:hypothetical protein
LDFAIPPRRRGPRWTRMAAAAVRIQTPRRWSAVIRSSDFAVPPAQAWTKMDPPRTKPAPDETRPGRTRPRDVNPVPHTQPGSRRDPPRPTPLAALEAFRGSKADVYWVPCLEDCGTLRDAADHAINDWGITNNGGGPPLCCKGANHMDDSSISTGTHEADEDILTYTVSDEAIEAAAAATLATGNTYCPPPSYGGLNCP